MALSQLVGREKFEALAVKAAGREVDENVRDEWLVAGGTTAIPSP